MTYTFDEHVILSEWLEVPPICAQEDLPYLDDALERLGFRGPLKGSTRMPLLRTLS